MLFKSMFFKNILLKNTKWGGDMERRLTNLFLDNPEYEHEIYRLYSELPEYKQAAKLVAQWSGTVKQLLGEDGFLAFEDALAHYYGIQAQASYLFGLHLRRELCDALMWETQIEITSAC